MVNSWERTSFRPLRLTNTLKDKSECFMSSNGELDASNGTQQNIKEVRSWLMLCECVFVWVKKPSGVFLMYLSIYLLSGTQWLAKIFVSSLEVVVIRLWVVCTMRNVFQGSGSVCCLLTKKLKFLYSLFLRSVNVGWFLHCNKSKISSQLVTREVEVMLVCEIFDFNLQ